MLPFYTGQAPKGILARALCGNVFVRLNLAHMNEGDRCSYNVYKQDVKNTLRKRTKNPSSTPNATNEFATYTRELCIVEAYEEFDPADYHCHWKALQPEGPFLWEALPREVQEVFEDLFLGSAAEAVEEALTNGDAVLGVTGLIPQLLSPALTPLNCVDPTTTQIVNNTAIAFRAHGGGTGDELGVVLTPQNIFEKLELLIRSRHNAMRKRPGFKFMVNYKTADIIMDAQRTVLEFKGVETTEKGILRYGGYEIVVNPSLPNDTIIFASMTGDMKTDAIQLGTSMSEDFNNVDVQRINNFNRCWGMLLTFAIDIFVARPEEVAFYTTEPVV